ncbi:hypothetical protein WJX73_007500 [Symbiochloris irregularis]|uniref:HTH HARE-type domain-containing protein n=1 Tax=Symbiochloris irregularis TaxID=706552 RepID=A0AAW1PRE2_9CHLO
MTTGEITRLALEQALIRCQGRTPEATMASALYTDVKRKHDKSVFTRPQEGLFGLREWGADGQHAPCSAPLQPDPDAHEQAAGIENLSPVKVAVAGHDCEGGHQVPDLSPRRGPPPAALCESPIRLLRPEHHARMAPIEALLGHRSALFPEPASFTSQPSASCLPSQQGSHTEASSAAIDSMLSHAEAGRLYSGESWLRLFRGNSMTGGGKDLEDLTAAQASMHARDGGALECGTAATDSMDMLGHALQPSTSAGICCAEEEVRALEHRLGTAHPRVGKAWLQLSRAYQQAGGEANVANSEQALLRAWHICSRFYVHSQHPPNPFNNAAPSTAIEQPERNLSGSASSSAALQARPDSASDGHSHAACFTHDFLI